jgi:hypothetical protein
MGSSEQTLNWLWQVRFHTQRSLSMLLTLLPPAGGCAPPSLQWRGSSDGPTQYRVVAVVPLGLLSFRMLSWGPAFSVSRLPMGGTASQVCLVAIKAMHVPALPAIQLCLSSISTSRYKHLWFPTMSHLCQRDFSTRFWIWFADTSFKDISLCW